MHLRRSAAVATIVITAAATIAGGGSLPATAIIDHHDTTHTTGPTPDAAADSRLGSALVKPTRAQLAAARRLVASAADGTRVTWDGRFGTPRSIYAPDGAALSRPRAGSPTAVARAFLADHRGAFGLSEVDVAGLEETGTHRLTGVDVTIVTFTQRVAGVPATRGGSMSVAVDGRGRVLTFAGSVARNTRLLGSFSLSAAEALRTAGARLGVRSLTATAAGTVAGFTEFHTGITVDGKPLGIPSYVQKAVFPTADGARAAFRVLLVKRLDEAYEVVLDAASGRELYRRSLVQHVDGTIYPNYPGAPKGGKPVKESFDANEQSPMGYVDPVGLGVTTFGNNADTFKNWSNFLVPADQVNRTVAPPTSGFHFDFPNSWENEKCAAAPPSYAADSDAAATNLFYHHNRIHDEFYALGFTETGGNFQLDGGDPIMGLVQAGALSGGEAGQYTGRDNAYMLTLPDGIPPWSGMFLWEPINDAFEGPCRDGDFDAGVIEHEYAHGLSNRYVGSEDGALGGHQSGSMGEGWGDWYALNYLHRENLQDDSVVGAYVTGNEKRGIRNWAYSKTWANFGDIGYDLGGPEVHSDGEIWTAALWDMRQRLVRQVGQQRAAEIAAFIVTDAMPLSPNDPSMLDMRDAIMKALGIRYGKRADYRALKNTVYTAFAQHGMGVHASNEKSELDPTGASDIDPQPSFAHLKAGKNGTLRGRVVNASTGKPVRGAKVMLGRLEAGVSPAATTGRQGSFAIRAVAGRYPLTIQARGFGARTLGTFRVRAGDVVSREFTLAPNLASAANGARIRRATAPQAQALLDDTEATRWTAPLKRGGAVIKLAEPARISHIQVSAFTTSRFEGVRSFVLQTSRDGSTWRTQRIGKNAFGFQAPRPTVGDLHHKMFELPEPVRAGWIRIWPTQALGETKTVAQFGDVQVFARGKVRVDPLPPPPKDKPFVEKFTIAASNPSGDLTGGGLVGQELAGACTYPPASQGSDGWVTKLPQSFGDGAHKVTATGSGPTYDLDLYFYNAACELIGDAASGAADESGALPSGTAYVVTSNWAGAATEVTLRAVDTQ